MLKAILYIFLGYLIGVLTAAIVLVPPSMEASDDLEYARDHLCDTHAPYSLLTQSYLAYKEVCEKNGYRVVTLEETYR